MTANLIPLQLDQSTGNLVAKALSGTYFPPSGTGFQFVTSGAPSTTAVTATQATALLNLFTPSLQGLVPPSGGGTTNFLRADGTFAAIPASGVTTFNTRTGAVTLTLSDVTTALGFTPYNATNPAGYLAVAVTSAVAGSGISVSGATGAVTFGNTGVLSFNTRVGAVVLSSADVTTALTFTPYNATNPSGFISALPAFTASGDITGTFVPGTPGNLPLTLPNIATAGTYGQVVVNAKGQVTSGVLTSALTTLAAYGITNGVATTVATTMSTGISVTFVGGGTVTGLPTPANSSDAANKAYVDALKVNKQLITTSATISVSNSTAPKIFVVLNGSTATVALTFPTAAFDGQIVALKFSYAITTLTLSGGTFEHALTSSTAGQYVEFIWDVATTTWY